MGYLMQNPFMLRNISGSILTITGEIVQSAVVAEYTNWIFAEGLDSNNECPGYETKQCDGKFPVFLELWGMQSTTSLPSLPGPLWSRVVAPDKVLSMG